MQQLIDLVAAHGVDRQQAVMIAEYIADRGADLSLTTLHSSGHSALSHDVFLTAVMGLTRGQIKAWLALLRGTRPVRRRDGLIVGGCPGFLQVIATGGPDPSQMRRYTALARRAAGTEPDAPGTDASGADTSCRTDSGLQQRRAS